MQDFKIILAVFRFHYT